MKVEICIATKSMANRIQEIFNHKCSIEYLGGFTHMDTIMSQIKKNSFRPSLFVARLNDGEIVAAAEISSRKQAHRAHHGKISVLPEFRRKGIGTALYIEQILTCMLEGRRKMEDTVVGDNPAMHNFLPKLGYVHEGTLEEHTASGKSLVLYSYFINRDKLETPIKVLKEKGLDVTFNLYVTDYTVDLYFKNLEIIQKHRINYNPKKLLNKVRENLRTRLNNMVTRQRLIEHPLLVTERTRGSPQ